MLNKSFGKVLRRLRTEKGHSQEDFGFVADLHRTYISQLERGLKSPTLSILGGICKALDITMSEFVSMIEAEEKKANEK